MRLEISSSKKSNDFRYLSCFLIFSAPFCHFPVAFKKRLSDIALVAATQRPAVQRTTPNQRILSGCSSGVEHNLAKVGVEGSNPFARSNFPQMRKIGSLARVSGHNFQTICSALELASGHRANTSRRNYSSLSASVCMPAGIFCERCDRTMSTVATDSVSCPDAALPALPNRTGRRRWLRR